MATLISCATGNFTISTTWALCSTNGALDSESGTTTLDTTNQDSSTFVLEANQIDAVALKLQSPAGSPSGTIAVTLRNSTTASNVATVTINASDLSSTAGWHVFKFGSNHTPNGTDSYLIRVASSVAGTIFYTNGTSKNWSRQVRRTTQQAPASGDKLIIAGQWTAAATFSSYIVTMNNTATTSFGVITASSPQSISVNAHGTITWGTSLTTSYYLKWKGIFGVFAGGTVNVGTSGTPVDATSTAVLEMDSTGANAESGFVAYPGSTVNIYGKTKSQYSFLSGGLSSGSTSLTLDTSVSGWSNGDEICIASTSKTRTECEKRTINAIADPATSLTITSATGVTRQYSLPYIKGEVANLTRNVKFRGTGTSTQGYVLFQTTSTVNAHYAEFTLLGTNGSPKRGVEATTSSGGTLNITNCSFHGSVQSGNYPFIWNPTTGTATIENNVVYNPPTAGIYIASATSDNSYTVVENIVMMADLVHGIHSVDAGGTFESNRIIGSFQHGIYIAEASYIGPLSINDNVCHANRLSGIVVDCDGGEITECTIDNLLMWRQEFGSGLDIRTNCLDVTLSDFVGFTNDVSFRRIIGGLVTNLSLVQDTSFSDTDYISFSNGSEVEIESSTLYNGYVLSSSESLNHIVVRNTDMSVIDDNEQDFSLAFADDPYSMLGVEKYDLTSGTYRITKYGCSIRPDTVIYRTNAPSMRMILFEPIVSPAVVTSEGIKGGFFVPVSNGSTRTVSVAIRKSVLADGIAYSGADQPKLVLKKDVALGVTSDTVIATATNAANGAFEVISGTTPTATDDGIFEFYVTCNNTSFGSTFPFINIDDFMVIS